MKDMETRLRDQHRKLWLWLAQNPTKYKSEWPGWQTGEVQAMMRTFPAIHEFMCFACYIRDIEKEIRGDIDPCGKTCPVQEWVPGKANKGHTTCCCRGSLFHQWTGRRTRPERKTSLALHIAFAWK